MPQFYHPTVLNDLVLQNFLRGLAALLVVLFHIPKWNPVLNIGIINNGYLMVELFFVLSGFVIFNAYSNKIHSGKDLLRFQFLRFGRLYPVHLLFLFIFILIEVQKYIAQSKFNIISPNTQPFRENNIIALVEHVFLLQAIGPTGNSQTFNIPSWSISVEFYTYLIFGLSALFFKKTRVKVFSAFALLPLIFLVTDITFGAKDLLKCLTGFFIGCLTADFASRIKIGLPKHAALAALALIIVFLQLKTAKYLDVAIYFMTSALIISIVYAENGMLKKVLNFKILTLLGTISYSVYMSHTSVIWTANQFFRIILKRPERVLADGRMTPQLSQLESILAASIVVALVFIISYFVYNFIEKPMRDKSRLIAAKI